MKQAGTGGVTTQIGSPDVTVDAFLGGRLSIAQSRTGLRAGLDAVLLAAAVSVPDGASVRLLDLGTGCGVVGLCVLSRVAGATFHGLDVNADLVALARANARRNGLDTRAHFDAGDVREINDTMTRCGLQPNTFDHVVANPPYFASGTVQRAPDPSKDRANVMEAGDLDAWVRFSAHAARANGVLTIVYTAQALPGLLNALEGRFGGVQVYPLFPRAGVPASRLIVQARKGSRTPMSLLPGLVLHEADGRFTQTAEDVLRHGASLILDPGT